MKSDGSGGSRFGAWLARRTAPSARLQDAVIREQATALSWLLLFMLFWLLAMAVLVRFVLTPGMGWRNPEMFIVLVAVLLLLLAYGLNRRGHYLSAASLTVVTLFAGVFAGTHLTLLGMLEPYYSRNSVDILSYLLLPLILGAVLLPMRLLVSSLVLAAVGVAIVPMVHPHVNWLQLLQGPLSYVLAAGALLLFVSYVMNVTRTRRYHMLEWREERYRSLFEQSPDAMFLVSTDGTVEAINSAGLALFGYAREEIEGGSIRQLYAVAEEREALIAKTERQGILVDEPLRMRRKDGAVLDCLVNIRLRTDPSGRVEGYQTVVRDVTARLKLDEDVKLKGQLLDLANDVVLLVDPGGEIMYSNEAAASLTGYPIDELVGMNIRRLNTPEGAEQVPSRISAMMRQGEYNFETVWVSRDGRRVDMEVRSRAVQSRGRMLFLSVGRDITRRKSDETELRLRSELLDLATDAVMLHDFAGKLLYVNEGAALQTGYTRTELLAMSLQDLDDAKSASTMRARMAELMNQRAIAFEAGYRRKDGVVIPVDVRARIVQWEDRGVVLAVARDISERKKADAALKAERDRAQRYLDVAAVIFVALDSRGTITLVNHRCVDMLGSSEKDLIGRNWFDSCVPSQERDRVRAVFEAMMRGEEVGQETYENEVVTASGELRTVAWRNVVLWGDDGRPSGTLSSGEDITERRAVERALVESEQRFRSLFEQSIDAIFGNAPDGSHMEANQAWLDLFGYTREDLADMNAADLYASADERSEYVRAMRDSGAVRDEVTLKKKDGSSILCQRVAFARRDTAGNVAAYQGIVRDITVQRRAERELRESEERYRALFEQSLDAIWTLRADGTGHVVNQAWLDMFGYTREDLSTLNAVDLYANPADRDDFLRRISRSGSVRDTVWFKRKDGTHVLCERTVVARRDDAGRIVAFQGVSRDITAAEQRKAALADEVTRRRLLVEQSSDGIVVLDEHGALVETNLAFARMLGYSMEEMYRLHVWDWDVPLPRETLLEMLATVDEKGDHFETQHRRKDGSTYDVEISSNGAVVGGRKLIFCVCRDISARNRAEQELRESEHRYRLIADDTLDVIWRMDMDMRFTYVNPSIQRMFGFTVDEWIGTLLAEHCSPDEFQRMRGMVAEQLEHAPEQSGVKFEAVMFGKNGAQFPVEIYARVLWDAGGRPYAIHGVTRDIAERKKTERELRESEEKFRSLFENSVAPISLISTEGRVLEANPAWFELFGYSPADLEHLNVGSQYAEPGGRARFLERIRTEGRLVDDEVQLKRRDGVVLDILRSVTVRRNADGTIAGFDNVFRDITAQKKAERALRESEEKYRTLFERSRDAVSLVAVDGTLLEANPAYLELFGYDPGDVGRINVRGHYVNPAERDEYLQLLERDGSVIERYTKLTRTDGTVMDCIRSSVVYRDESGRIVSIQTVTRDVTKLLQAEEELRQSEQKYRSLFEQSMDAVAIYALDGTLLDANPAHLALFGLTSADLGKRNVLSVYVNPADRVEFLRLLERDGVVVDQEVRLRKVDGTEMDCVRTAVARRDVEGRLVAAQTVTRDITERKRAEEELRDSETRFRTLVEHTGLGIAISRTDGTIVDCNDALPSMLGYTRGEFLALRVPDVYASREERESVLARAMRDGHVRDIEATFRRKDGAPLYVLMNSSLVPMQGSTVVVSQFLDITERKAAELELLRSREELQRSAEQLHELTTYLEKARENERTGIARELHDQLGQALTALRMDLDGVTRAVSSRGEAPTDRLARMAALLDETVDDVRRISSELRPGILDDAGLVPAIEWQLDRFRERSGIECRLIAHGDDAGLDRAASTALFRVFQELLTNVARHAGASRVQVVFDRDDSEYVLSVSDDGKGITEDEISNPTSLGIIGIRERLRPLDGSIEFRTRRPKGTMVRVCVPARKP